MCSGRNSRLKVSECAITRGFQAVKPKLEELKWARHNKEKYPPRKFDIRHDGNKGLEKGAEIEMNGIFSSSTGLVPQCGSNEDFSVKWRTETPRGSVA
jgi:hypothetical protein